MGRAIRDHGRSHNSDVAKEQLSSGPRFLAQARALPISNDPIRVCSGAASTARGKIQGQLVAETGPGGPSAAAPRRGLATHWRRLRYWRRHKRQQQEGGGAAGSELGGCAQPNHTSARNKIQ